MPSSKEISLCGATKGLSGRPLETFGALLLRSLELFLYDLLHNKSTSKMRTAKGPEVRERLRASGAYSSRERINRNERRYAATIEVAERPQSPWKHDVHLLWKSEHETVRRFPVKQTVFFCTVR